MKSLLLAAVLLLSACGQPWNLEERAKECYRQGGMGILVTVTSVAVPGAAWPKPKDIIVWSMTTACGPPRAPAGLTT